MTSIHILNNGLNIHIYESTIFILLIAMIFIIAIVPVIAVIIHIILLMILLVKKILKQKIENRYGKEIISTSIMIIIAMIAVILFVSIVSPEKYICLDILIIFMSILIVKTDHLMLKNDEKIMRDYKALREMENRIKEYSLIKERQINYMKLWEEYLIYAVAFGIPVQIVDKLSGTYKDDEDIRYMLEAEILYYICKAYLEIMWDMNFKKKGSLSLRDLL